MVHTVDKAASESGHGALPMPSWTKPDICIYHAPCQDGFTAAWAIWRRWPDIQFVAGVYGTPPPDVLGKHVLIVDFSYKRPVLQALGELAASITILDHHKSAEADLAPFKVTSLATTSRPAFVDEGLGGLAGPYPVQALFDMTKSGAMMAWEYAHGLKSAPSLVHHVQDRDLWRFDLPFTREIAANLFSMAYEFDEWDHAAAELDDPSMRGRFVAEGAAIERKHHKDVGELLAQAARSMVIGGHRVPVANIPYTMSSDAANQLAEGQAFAACYFDNAAGKRVFSLRSKPEGLDVSVIASSYGGGGHARAAGFSAPLNWEGDSSPDGGDGVPVHSQAAAPPGSDLNPPPLNTKGKD